MDFPRLEHSSLRVAARLSIVLVVLVAAGCGSSEEQPARPEQPAAAPPAATSNERQDAEPDASPLEQVVGDLVMTKLTGPVPSAEELTAIRGLGFGGVILFGPNVVDEVQLRALVDAVDEARGPAARRAGLPPRMLVSVDQEGGAIRNIPFAPPTQTQPGLVAGGVDAARAVALDTGRALAGFGVSMDLGPVADLAAGPNRTMAGRSFGEDAAAVAPFVAATVGGLQEGGVATAAKHFPGFGASTANSDEAVAYVDRTREELLATELVPFRAAIEARVDVVMVSHGVHRKLGSTLPGTLDPLVATGLLRDELGFTGVAMTDSMNARGFREAWGDTVPRACPVAIAAGIDLLLLTGTIETARLCRARILDAVEDGSLPEARVREAVARVDELRARVAP